MKRFIDLGKTDGFDKGSVVRMGHISAVSMVRGEKDSSKFQVCICLIGGQNVLSHPRNHQECNLIAIDVNKLIASKEKEESV